MPGLILDSGAITFLATPTGRSDALLRELRPEGPFMVPTAVLIECLTGTPRDTAVHRVLKTCRIVPDISRQLAQRAALLRFAAGRGSAVDALIVALAEDGGRVVSGDGDDIPALADHARNVRVSLI